MFVVVVFVVVMFVVVMFVRVMFVVVMFVVVMFVVVVFVVVVFLRVRVHACAHACTRTRREKLLSHCGLRADSHASDKHRDANRNHHQPAGHLEPDRHIIRERARRHFERNNTDSEHDEDMAERDDQTQVHGLNDPLPESSLRADQVGGDHGFSVSGRERVRCTVEHGEEDQAQKNAGTEVFRVDEVGELSLRIPEFLLAFLRLLRGGLPSGRLFVLRCADHVSRNGGQAAQRARFESADRLSILHVLG